MRHEVLIKSCVKNYDRQQACDLTWAGKLRRKGIIVRILLGGFSHERLHDASIRTTTGDSYEDNTHKLQSGLRQLLAVSDFQYLFVCDDDTFVHPRRWLEHSPAGELECRVFTPKKMGKREAHPWIHGGGGWWMSRRLASYYVSENIPLDSADDVWMANVARKKSINMLDRPDLYGGDRYSREHHRVAADNTFITCHHVSPQEMYELYEATYDL